MPKQELKILFLADVPQHAASSHPVVSTDAGKRLYRQCVTVPPDAGLCYPSEFSDEGIPDGSIAYHPIFGNITYQGRWRFSTRQFVSDIQAADANPAVRAHLIHVDSCGGEAFGLHEAFLAVKALEKPVYAIVESIAASAGYYLAAAADKVFASSIFSEVGSIGVVCTTVDDSAYLEKEGIKVRDIYSNYSPLKGKVQRDAADGNDEEFVKRFLDPMALQFIEDVKSVRGTVTQDAQEGELYYAAEAQAAGLIDGQNSLDEVLALLRAASEPKEKSPSVDINKLTF